MISNVALTNQSCFFLCVTLKNIGRNTKTVIESIIVISSSVHLVEWSYEWKLDFNTDKCSLCSVTRQREPITYDYTMGIKNLMTVDNQRDLGVLITCNA